MDNYLYYTNNPPFNALNNVSTSVDHPVAAPACSTYTIDNSEVIASAPFNNTSNGFMSVDHSVAALAHNTYTNSTPEAVAPTPFNAPNNVYTSVDHPAAAPVYNAYTTNTPEVIVTTPFNVPNNGFATIDHLVTTPAYNTYTSNTPEVTYPAPFSAPNNGFNSVGHPVATLAYEPYAINTPEIIASTPFNTTNNVFTSVDHPVAASTYSTYPIKTPEAIAPTLFNAPINMSTSVNHPIAMAAYSTHTINPPEVIAPTPNVPIAARYPTPVLGVSNLMVDNSKTVVPTPSVQSVCWPRSIMPPNYLDMDYDSWAAAPSAGLPLSNTSFPLQNPGSSAQHADQIQNVREIPTGTNAYGTASLATTSAVPYFHITNDKHASYSASSSQDKIPSFTERTDKGKQGSYDETIFNERLTHWENLTPLHFNKHSAQGQLTTESPSSATVPTIDSGNAPPQAAAPTQTGKIQRSKRCGREFDFRITFSTSIPKRRKISPHEDVDDANSIAKQSRPLGKVPAALPVEGPSDFPNPSASSELTYEDVFIICTKTDEFYNHAIANGMLPDFSNSASTNQTHQKFGFSTEAFLGQEEVPYGATNSVANALPDATSFSTTGGPYFYQGPTTGINVTEGHY